MEQDVEFRNYNLYRRLVRRQLVKPYTHFCGTEYISAYGPDDAFALKCTTCDVIIDPGLAALKVIASVVKENFE